jgi:DNA-binding GntR family transcriptional regulator
MSVFTPITSESTGDLLADNIRAAIIDGRIAPGDRLIEMELAAQFETSRAPVREAIRLLSSERLVQLRRNRGAVVVTPTIEDVLEVYAMRLSLGGIALARAVEIKAGEHQEFSAAREALGHMRDPAVRANPVAMVDADLAVQSATFALSQLPRICAALSRTENEIRFFVTALGITYDTLDRQAQIERHERVLDAIEAGDADAAIATWDTHIQRTIAEFTTTHEFTQVNHAAQGEQS